MTQGHDRFRRVFENAPTAMYLWVLDQGELVLAGANAAADLLLGLDHRELLGRRIEDAFPGLRGRGLAERFLAVARDGGSTGLERIDYRDERLNGSYEFSAFQIAPGEVAVTFTEINARLRGEDELRAREEKYRLLVENQTDVVVKVDLEGRFLFVSPSYCRLFGKTEAELIGKTFMPLVHEEDREGTARAMDDLYRPPYAAFIEQRALTVHGWRWIAWVDTAVRDAEDRVVAIVGVGRDVTERREVQERLRRSEKLEAVGRLAGGVAHDFNNQLTGILGGAEFLREALADDAELLSVVESIRDASLRSARLTRQLLAFSRRDERRSAVVDLRATLEELAALLERSIDKRIAIRTELPAGRTVVRGDPDRLHSALLNVSLNARDAMREGGTLTLSSRTVVLDDARCAALPAGLAPGPHVELSVRDTGVGLTTEARDHLFEPFFTTKETGSGLGLAEVYGTVQAHRGAIAFDSAAGQGTTVTIWLPAADEEARVADAPALGVAGKRPLRVLVVDDEPNVRRSLGLLLRSAGHQVVECAGGREAVERYARDWRDLDVVILDVMMPDLRGREVFARLRAANPNVRVIVSSGFSVGEEDALAAEGGVELLPKPYTADQLARALAAATLASESRDAR
jgi:PAS domain S-box-containing protein